MKENILIWIAYHLPPRLVEWCFVRVVANASVVLSNQELPSITVADALQNWRKG